MAPQTPAENESKFAAHRRKPHAGGIDQAHAIADLAAIAALKVAISAARSGEGFTFGHVALAVARADRETGAPPR